MVSQFVQVCLMFLVALQSTIASQSAAIEKGRLTYDPAIEVCCSAGTVRPRLHGNATQCCGSDIYDASVDMCCSDVEESGASAAQGPMKILPLALDERTNPLDVATSYAEFQCCGNRTLNGTVQVCCNGRPVDRLFANTGCCGDRVYDKNRFDCCGGGVVARRSRRRGSTNSCCGTQSFNPRRQICCQGKIHRNWGLSMGCCGAEVFTIGQAMCCSNTVNNDPFGLLGCCGNRTYELLNDICCDGVVSPDPFHTMACCASRAYSTKTDICCNGVVVPRDVGSTKHICCQGRLVPMPPAGRTDGFFSCCGQQVFDQETELCCSAKIRKRTSPATKCCGTGTYDKGEICCGDVVLSKDLLGGDINDDYSANKDRSANGTTRTSTTKCCKNRVVKVPEGHEVCC